MKKDKETVFNSIPELNYTETTLEIDATEFCKVVESRRSVRVYDGTPIPEDIVNKCLDLALLAPNSSNLQPWEFHWVKSKNKKEQLIKACFSQPAASTAAELFVAVGRIKTWKKHAEQMLKYFATQEQKTPQSAISYYKKIVPLAYNLGPFGLLGLLKKIILPVIGIFNITPREPTSQMGMKLWASKSTALACENLMLAFRAHGFDTCPMEGLDSKRVAKILDLPRDAFVVMAISAGKREARGVYGPRVRFPRSQFIREH